MDDLFHILMGNRLDFKNCSLFLSLCVSLSSTCLSEPYMHKSRIFCRVGGGGGGGGVQARLPENSSEVVCFFLLLLLLIFVVFNLNFFTVLQWFINGYFKEYYNFTRFQRGSNIFQGGGGGSNIFQGGGGGVNANL